MVYAQAVCQQSRICDSFLELKKDVQLGSKVSKFQTAWKDGEGLIPDGEGLIPFPIYSPVTLLAFFKLGLMFCIFTNACLSVYLYHMWAEVGTRFPETGVRHGCEGLCGCWELTLRPV